MCLVRLGVQDVSEVISVDEGLRFLQAVYFQFGGVPALAYWGN